MTGFAEVRTKVAGLSPAAQETVTRRFVAYRRDVWRAGHPWTWYALAAWALAFVSFVAPRALGLTEIGFIATLLLLVAGVVFDRAAAKKKRAYELAHPFEV